MVVAVIVVIVLMVATQMVCMDDESPQIAQSNQRGMLGICASMSANNTLEMATSHLFDNNPKMHSQQPLEVYMGNIGLLHVRGRHDQALQMAT